MCTRNQNVAQEEKKHLMIMMPNAVVDPRTMVIHLQYTYSACATMMSSRWFEAFAAFAMLQKLFIGSVLWLPSFWRVPWSSKGRLEIAIYEHDD
mmetsp:Transcript_17530/g.26269  ORF Transcript_17530/g.26269 Transcript_17530/m.26269 type:complete len:94 (+) Transcript_17530:1075-1356(+)